jgi:hypothetical protein
MKFMYWNIIVFNNPTRRRQLRDLILEEGLDGIGIQETIKKEFSTKDLSDVIGGFQWI